MDSGTVAPKGIVLPDTQHRHQAHARVQGRRDLRGQRARPDEATPASPRPTRAPTRARPEGAWLASLGVTAVEFLPVQETQNDTNDVVPNTDTGDNYWGYSTLNWFAPDRRYSYDKTAGGPTKEFKAMVQAFHNAGIKVMLDVVYNHTGEGGAWSSTDTTTYNVMSSAGSTTRPTTSSPRQPVELRQHRRRRQLQHLQHRSRRT
jgi:isoamylase